MASPDDFTARIRARLGLPAAGNGVQREAATGVLPIGPDETSSAAGSSIEESTGAGDSRSSAPSLSAVPPPPVLTNGHLERAQFNIREAIVAHWQDILMESGREAIKDPAFQDRDNLMIELARVAGHLPDTMTTNFPLALDSAEYEGALNAVAVRLLNQLPVRKEEQEIIIWEGAEQALISNAEYLSRPAIVEKLYYTLATSLGVGGKHEGKSTASRTESLAIATGRTVWDRKTTQTPVIYVASDDEYPTTRMELLRMGWNPAIPLYMVAAKVAQGMPVDPERILVAIAKLAQAKDAHFVILDMLFDFISIQDEIKYAQTRYATGFVQRLADAINGHVKATHHSPKWMPDAANAAKAALGSQGIAARFSPIVFSKQWTDDLYTIESTKTRDPRGEKLAVTCVKRDEKGWAVTDGKFQAWMKWKLYEGRIMGMFEGEAGKRITVQDVMTGCDINRPEAQNALLQMTKNGTLDRDKTGKSYKYYLKEGTDLFVDGWQNRD